jgi:flagellar biosynthetic protein FliQ
VSSDFALALSTEMLWTAIFIAAPVLGLSMLVGLLSIFQVVTQIQEMSLTFVPKILTVAITLIVFGPWMLGKLLQFASTVIGNIPMYFEP